MNYCYGLMSFMAAATLLSGIQASLAAQNEQPNILLVMADDMGYGDMGCAGHPYVKTPHIDRLAREGTMFKDFYVNSGVCAPSRVAFLSGQFPARQNVHSIYSNAAVNRKNGIPDFLDPDILTVADVLSDAGYATEHIGKWHICGRAGGPPPGEYGFGSWLVSNPPHIAAPVYRERMENSAHSVSESSRWMVDDAIDFMNRNRGSEKPFFINLCFLAPHSPLKPTPEEFAVYEDLHAFQRLEDFVVRDVELWSSNNGDQWVEQETIVNRQADAAMDRVALKSTKPGTARYFKLNVRKAQGAKRILLGEIEIGEKHEVSNKPF